MTQYIKDLRLSVYRFAAGSPCSRSEVNCRLTKDGIPRILSEVHRSGLRSGDFGMIREILSV